MKATIQGMEVEGTPEEIYKLNDFYQDKSEQVASNPLYARGGYVGDKLNIEISDELVTGGVSYFNGITLVGE